MFQTVLCKNMSSINSNTCNVDNLWTLWKKAVEEAASETVGKRKLDKKYRTFWDKELDSLLKQRKEFNRLKRIYDKSRPHDDLCVNI